MCGVAQFAMHRSTPRSPGREALSTSGLNAAAVSSKRRSTGAQRGATRQANTPTSAKTTGGRVAEALGSGGGVYALNSRVVSPDRRRAATAPLSNKPGNSVENPHSISDMSFGRLHACWAGASGYIVQQQLYIYYIIHSTEYHTHCTCASNI